MTPSQFNKAARSAGLLLPRVGLLAVNTLKNLCAAQVEMITAPSSDRRACAPASVGTLIRHGLATLDREKGVYHATAEGQEYLRKLKAEGLV